VSIDTATYLTSPLGKDVKESTADPNRKLTLAAVPIAVTFTLFLMIVIIKPD